MGGATWPQASVAEPLGVEEGVAAGLFAYPGFGCGPSFVKLGNLVRYSFEDVELWLARQLELSRR